MSRILIDCAYIDFSKQPTGIPRVVLKYIEIGYEWGVKNGVEVIPVVTTDKGCFIVEPLPGENPPESLINLINLMLKEEKDDAKVTRKPQETDDDCKKIIIKNGDILFCPAYWHDLPASFYKNAKKEGAKIIILVHDILPITHSKYYNYPWRQDTFLANVLHACEYADAFFTVSKYTADSLIQFAKRRKINLPPIAVSYNGYETLVDVDDCPSDHEITLDFWNPLASSVFDCRPFLMVGSVEPKKGHIPVIDTFELMWQLGFQKKLVIVGRRGWKFQEIENKIIKSKYYNENLFWFDDLDDVDLFLAYKKSLSLIFSSVSEGFGLPIIEAINCNCPVIYYDNQISREVARGCGIPFRNQSSLVKACLEISVDKNINCIDNINKWPSWDQYTPKVFSFMLNELPNLSGLKVIEL